jgi:hypothetical protein
VLTGVQPGPGVISAVSETVYFDIPLGYETVTPFASAPPSIVRTLPVTETVLVAMAAAGPTSIRAIAPIKAYRVLRVTNPSPFG